MFGKARARKRKELLEYLQGLVGKRIYRSACHLPEELDEEAHDDWDKLNLQFIPVMLVAVDHGRLFVKVEHVICKSVEYLVDHIVPLPECFIDDVWAEWPVAPEDKPPGV